MTDPDLPAFPARPEQRLALVEERAQVGVVRRDAGGVRVEARTETRVEAVEATAATESVEVTRVPVNRAVEAPSGPRTETVDGDEVTILPVHEERIVVERRWVLVEEIHLRRRRSQTGQTIPVELRREVAHVTRLPPGPSEESVMLTDTEGYQSTTRTLTALFDSSAEAERAVERLRRAGVPDASIRVHAGTGATETGYEAQHRGFWDSLADFFFPDEDRYAYAEGLARGAQLVTVSNYDAVLHDQIVDILDDEGSIDLDARAGEWKAEGWRDYRESDYYDAAEYDRTHRPIGAAVGGAAARAADWATDTVDRAVDAVDGPNRSGLEGRTDRADWQMAADASGAPYTGSRVGSAHGSDAAFGRDADDATVKVVEERLDVGKREAEGGRVRVRSYVREEPVEAEVDLRSTRVFLDRRPVDRPADTADLAFQDRTIEAREHVEEPVVRKEARVVEEIGLREETETRTERVSDTVRKTEVEIEDERTGETQRISPDRDRF